MKGRKRNIRQDLKRVQAKRLRQERASGVDEEYTERDRIVTDIVERIKECDLAADTVKRKKRKNGQQLRT